MKTKKKMMTNPMTKNDFRPLLSSLICLQLCLQSLRKFSFSCIFYQNTYSYDSNSKCKASTIKAIAKDRTSGTPNETGVWLALYNGSIEACGALGPGSIPGAGPTFFQGGFE